MPYADLVIYLDDIKERADYEALLAKLRRDLGLDEAATGTYDE